MQLPADVAAAVARAFLLIAALLCATAIATIFAAVGYDATAFVRAGTVAFALLAVALLIAAWLARRGRIQTGVLVAAAAMIIAVAVFAYLSNRGTQSIALAISGMLVVVVGGVTGARAAAVVAALAAFLMGALYLSETHGMLPRARDVAWIPAEPRSLWQLVLLMTGLAFAWMVAGIVRASLRQSRREEQRFGALLGIAADWYWEQDEDLRFTNYAPCREFRIDRPIPVPLGARRWELPGVDLDYGDWEAHRAALNARRPFRDFIARRLDANGLWVYLSISGEPVFGPGGAFRGYWGVSRRVTSEVESQRAIAASEQRFRDLFMHAPSAHIIHRGGTTVLANAAAARLFGYASAEEMVGGDLLALCHPDSRGLAAQRLDQVERMPVGSTVPIAGLRMERRDGASLRVEAAAVRIEYLGGPANLSLFIDITERSRVEAALARSEAMLSSLFAASVDAMIVFEAATGRVVLANDSFAALTGYALEEVRGRTTVELNLWAQPERRADFMAALLENRVQRNYLLGVRDRSGRDHSLLTSTAMFRLDGVDYAVSIGRDVTQSERQRLEYAAILSSAAVGIAFTREGRFQLVNPHFIEMFGWSAEELYGQPTTLIWASPERFDARRDEVMAALRRLELVQFDEQMRHRNGRAFWCRLRGRMVGAEGPTAGAMIWMLEDITAWREAEHALAQAKDEAEAASRAKSAFLANMSHEIRTPLSGVLGLARLALDPKTESVEQKEYLERIVDSAESLAAIISDILDLSKIEAGKLTIESVTFNLRHVVASIDRTYRELAAEKGLAFHVRIGEDVPHYVSADPVRTRQILTNLVSNALKFTERGHIEIAARTTPSGHVRFAVTDTGIGVEPAMRARLFHPFMQADASTTRRFGGSGLGLSICRQLALLMGGEVGVDSTPGRGSTFWAALRLPVAAAPAPGAARPGTAEPRLDGLRVLLVEDNPVNRLIAATLLGQWGLEVVEADDGKQALEAVERANGRFDVVLMDVHMPVMSGHEATIELRKRYGKDELPIIALTAAALLSEQEQSLALGMNDFVTKPFDNARLRQAIARATAARSGVIGSPPARE